MEVIVIVTTKFGVIVTIINIICAYQKKNIICVRVDFLHYLFSTLSLSSPYDYHLACSSEQSWSNHHTHFERLNRRFGTKFLGPLAKQHSRNYQSIQEWGTLLYISDSSRLKELWEKCIGPHGGLIFYSIARLDIFHMWKNNLT